MQNLLEVIKGESYTLLFLLGRYLNTLTVSRIGGNQTVFLGAVKYLLDQSPIRIVILFKL